MQTMYDAVINSPNSQLANAIDDTQVTFDVVDGSILPDAPNRLTIGYDKDNPETVLLTLKVGNTLTVSRGLEGSARAWDGGTQLARVFTAGDYAAMKVNIEELEAGGVASFVTTDKFVSETYVYLIGDVSNGWRANRYDVTNSKTTSSGVSNKPSTLSECEALIYT